MKIFDKKKIEQEITVTSTKKIDVISRPRICCLDLTTKDIKILENDGANIYSGTLGNKIKVPNTDYDSKYQILLNFDFPTNIHEYDIFILDLNQSITIDYKSEDHIRKDNTGKSSIYLLSSYPAKLFDPRPLCSTILKKKLYKISKRRCMMIVFTTGSYDIDYDRIKISSQYPERENFGSYNIYSFFDNIPLSESLSGDEIKVLNVRSDLQALLEKHIKGATYNQPFFHPTTWEKEERINDKNYVPLLVNQNEDIVSYFNHSDIFNLFVFPQFQNKGAFLSEFLKVIGPSISPELFPFSTQYSWKKDKEYWLPNEEDIAKEKNKISDEYENKLQNIEEKIKQNKSDYSFLHNILTESGGLLVDSVIKFLKWLGFQNIRDMDKESEGLGIKEEDLQIDIDAGLIVIEVKGIGGTSTDSECSQISKIKHRRCQERNAFDVFALYLVNHQRYLPPLKRKNPPFTSEQISDAKNDERGLLTTWQLYNLYFDIENGILTKEEAIKDFIEFGFIEFVPDNLIIIDEPKEILKDGFVCIINIKSITLKIGDELYVEKNRRFFKSNIKSIMLDNKNIDVVSNGEIGLKLSMPIKKKSKLWKKSS